jgi:8-oxo-dGTP pyrophosphatase MutT (NUDIX family)
VVDRVRELLALLDAHRPEDEREALDCQRMRAFAAELADPFSREQWPAHFTASAVVVNAAGDRVCLVFHKKLERWLQPGGHMEAGEATAEAALREAREETNLGVELHPRWPAVLDLDVHVIPARGASPEHEHLDVRYLLLAGDERARHDPNESLALDWFGWDEALGLVGGDLALARLLGKAKRLTSS